ncbi:MAG: sigma-70 family RNA polymerase sigma factor [Planctomycetota bacterium]
MTDPRTTEGTDSAAEAFAARFAADAPALVAWATCRIGRELRARIDVEDLVQEVGMRACLRAEAFDPRRGTFRQWLLGFANRVWLETLRELGRDPLGPRRRRGGDSQLPGVPNSVTTISRRAANDEAARACRARIDALDEPDRRLLVAVGIEGLSHVEAALLLGIGEDASRKRWQRLRERLRDDPILRACVD